MSPEKLAYLKACSDEANTCLMATEAFFQERGIELVSTLLHDEPNYFTVVAKVSEDYSFMAVNRSYYLEDLDLNRYIHLETWTLIDHRKLKKEVDNTLDQLDNPQAYEDRIGLSSAEHMIASRLVRTPPYSYQGPMDKMVQMWRELEKVTKSMSYAEDTQG